MRMFLQKIYGFLQGRYGNDQLNNFLMILWGIIFIINLFTRNWILSIIGLVPLGLALYRSMSKNITKRMYENNKFLPIYKAVKNFITLQIRKIKEIKTMRYFKCPSCKAQLRVPKRKGVHTVRCPKCRKEFKKNIMF